MAVREIGPLGILADLSAEPWAAALSGQSRQLLGVNGKVLVWSPGSTVIGTIYNRSLFKRHGIRTPRTWRQLLEVCDRLHAAGVAPIAVGNQTPWVTQLLPYVIAASTAYVRDPRLAQKMRAGRMTFAASGWRDTFERYLELSRRRCFAESPNGTTLERQQALLASGEAAMIVQVAPTMDAVRTLAPGASFGMFPFPANDRPQDLRVAAGLAVGLAINARSPRADEAKRFLNFLSSPRELAHFNATGFSIPLDATSRGTVAPFLKPFVPFFERDATVPFMDQLWPNPEVQREHFAVVQDLLASRASVDEALRRLDAAYARR